VGKEKKYTPAEKIKYFPRRGTTRREFILTMTTAGTAFALAPKIGYAARQRGIPVFENVKLHLNINGAARNISIDPRVTLLDLLRENFSMHGTKKGCDHGQCGACTVLVNDRRVNACLILAATCENAEVTSIEGLAQGDKLHPMQEAFIKHDAFQCGYCTPGQICSAVGLVKEGHAKTDADIQELMSGNICRCGAYRNILAAVKEVQQNA